MKIETQYVDRWMEDECSTYAIRVTDGERPVVNFHVADAYDSPEDSTLKRDLKVCLDIPDMMRAAYEAGKRGDTFEVVEVPLEVEELY